ncbi:ABC transporter substrate-binding protein [Clostridium folliculivorans]|uniref:ABC transporter substrate-binding protein n=1 Tax=Clostridium folliculivorans TaxID=2886038 RepID=A0A9W5XYV1_9CLOT|nr:ABC transporter substrate-binding protein [Clostridium folliculivorans]GKU23455.1 ABC transporter substrate-binding protein [Clostridium folliculivorans]GKU29571.1 ABC transporter substrate-binding protein [Clostridium folliculivorans]
MKRSKKILSLLMAVALSTTALTACGNSESKESANSSGKNGSPDEIVYAFTTFNKISEDLGSVEKAINDITVPKINVKVKLKPLSVSNYSQQVNLAIQSGEQLDVFHTLGDLNQYISKNELMPLDDLLDKYGKETKQIVGNDFLETTKSNGKTYAVPSNKGAAIAPNLVYRVDIMNELGISPDSIKTVNDLDALYEKVKAKYPNMIPVAPTNQGISGVLHTIDNVDYLTDDLFKPTAVLIGDSTKVVDFYETDAFKEKVKIAREWYNKGYLSKDAATTNTLASELISSDRCFSYVASYAGKESAAQISAVTGKNMGMIRLAQPYLSTTNVNAVSWGIASTSQKPEAAMKFLNLTYSDKAVVNLLIYGIEGTDYVKVDADHVKYPDGKDANSVPYTAQLSCGIIGNQFIQYSMAGQSTDDLKLMESENKNSTRSKAFGFTFDSTSVKTEYSSAMNVINQYLPGLNCGALDPDKEIPNFIKKLKDAGMDKIVAEKQKQLDAWLATKK